MLQKFYDAKYIDSRDGKKKTGKELSSGRTRRSRELNYTNLRQFRKENEKYLVCLGKLGLTSYD